MKWQLVENLHFFFFWRRGNTSENFPNEFNPFYPCNLNSFLIWSSPHEVRQPVDSELSQKNSEKSQCQRPLHNCRGLASSKSQGGPKAQFCPTFQKSWVLLHFYVTIFWDSQSQGGPRPPWTPWIRGPCPFLYQSLGLPKFDKIVICADIELCIDV